jgi:hypothetical protein
MDKGEKEEGSHDGGPQVEVGPSGFYRFQPVADADEGPNVETNLARPLTDAIITVRIIKSFAYRSMKALVLRNVDLTTTTVDDLKSQCREAVRTNPAFKPFRSWADKFDSLKIYTRAHGAKTTNLIINLDHPEWFLEDGQKTLQEVGLENEAELSFFLRQDYEDFIKDPETKW